MAFLDLQSGARFFASQPKRSEPKVAVAVVLEIADRAEKLQERFLAKIGLTLRQAQRLSSAEKDQLQKRYREFLLG